MKHKVEIATSGNRCCPEVTVRLDGHPVELDVRVNGRCIDESRLLDLVHYAGMLYAVDLIESLPDGESVDEFLQGVMEA